MTFIWNDTVDLLEELPANLVNRILNTVDQADRTLINQLLNYPDDSAGTLMTTEYVDIRETMTVAQAMAHIKETGIHKETNLHLLCNRSAQVAWHRQCQRSDDNCRRCFDPGSNADRDNFCLNTYRQRRSGTVVYKIQFSRPPRSGSGRTAGRNRHIR